MADRRTVRAKSAANMAPPRLCQACGLPLAKGVDGRTRYHADCHKKWVRRRQRAKQALRARGEAQTPEAIEAEMRTHTSDMVEGEKVHRLLTTDVTEATLALIRLSPDPQLELQHQLAAKGLFAQIMGGHMSAADVGRMLGVHPTQMSRAVAALTERMTALVTAETSKPKKSVEAMLFRQPCPKGDPVAQWKWANEATDAFLAFEAEYMRLPNGELYERTEFHRRWVLEFMFALGTGGYLQILAPPRHGKSQLFAHLCVWLIARNPNIRILWCGPSGPIAEDFTEYVGQVLAENDRLVADCAPAGTTFAPAKRGQGSTWTKAKFTVANRDSLLVGATMTAIGRGAKILSRNVDILVCDDIEDQDSIAEPRTRRKTRRWFTIMLDSRKEEHTALMVIGSRQDYDDLYRYNLLDPNFRTVVDRAHDPACPLPPHNLDIHTECVLWPGVRTYRWLYSKKTGSGVRSGSNAFEDANLYDLVYQNIAQKSSSNFWSESMCATAHNAGRVISPDLEGIPEEGRTLVGGLDPASSGFQAAFLWALTPEVVSGFGDRFAAKWGAQDYAIKRWMVDLDNRRGGGIGEALELFEEWLELYGLRHWVIEDMAMQNAFTTDPKIRFWARTNEVHIESFTTGKNKWAKDYGLGAMTRLWTEGLVDLPYGDAESQRKTDLYDSQLLQFDGSVDSERRRQKDLHMASWFPQKVARRREKELAANAEERAPDRSHLVYADASYPEVTGFLDWNSAPWR